MDFYSPTISPQSCDPFPSIRRVNNEERREAVVVLESTDRSPLLPQEAPPSPISPPQVTPRWSSCTTKALAIPHPRSYQQPEQRSSLQPRMTRFFPLPKQSLHEDHHGSHLSAGKDHWESAGVVNLS